MEILASFSTALEYFTLGHTWILLLGGGFVALILGLLPGLSGTEAMLLLLPFTYRMNLVDTMLLMMSAYAAAFVGGAVTGILFGIPGSSTNIVTTFDGHPMARQGRAFEAIGAAASSSCIGGILSIVLVVMLMPFMEPFSLLFGPPEWFAFVLFGLIVLSMSGEGRFSRSLVSGFLGLLLSCIGLSVVTADVRYTFGSAYLWGGISIIPAFVGLYPLAEAVDMTFTPKDETEENAALPANQRTPWDQLIRGCREGATRYRALLLGSFAGWFIGVVPGVGGSLANMMGYVLVKETSKEPDTFGKGNVEGIVASEAANNASVGGALIPALALGIPGSLNTGILLGIFLLNGIEPGTNVFGKHLDVTWVILLAAAAGTIIGSIIILAAGWRLAGVLHRLDMRLIVPIIVFIGSIAAYLTRSNIMDVVLAFGLAIVGYAMKKADFSRLAFVIALMLGSLFEQSFFQSLNIGRGSYSIFSSSVTLWILWSLVLLALIATSLRNYKLWLQEKKKTGRQPEVIAEKVYIEKTESNLFARFLIILIGILSVVFLAKSFGFRSDSALIPRALSIMILILICYEVIRQMIKARATTLAGDKGTMPPVEMGRVKYALWMFSCLVILYVFGFLPAILIGTLFYLRIFVGLGWVKSSVSSGIFAAMTYLVFIVAANFSLYNGVV